MLTQTTSSSTGSNEINHLMAMFNELMVHPYSQHLSKTSLLNAIADRISPNQQHFPPQLKENFVNHLKSLLSKSEYPETLETTLYVLQRLINQTDVHSRPKYLNKKTIYIDAMLAIFNKSFFSSEMGNHRHTQTNQIKADLTQFLLVDLVKDLDTFNHPTQTLESLQTLNFLLFITASYNLTCIKLFDLNALRDMMQAIMYMTHFINEASLENNDQHQQHKILIIDIIQKLTVALKEHETLTQIITPFDIKQHLSLLPYLQGAQLNAALETLIFYKAKHPHYLNVIEDPDIFSIVVTILDQDCEKAQTNATKLLRLLYMNDDIQIRAIMPIKYIFFQRALIHYHINSLSSTRDELVLIKHLACLESLREKKQAPHEEIPYHRAIKIILKDIAPNLLYELSQSDELSDRVRGLAKIFHDFIYQEKNEEASNFSNTSSLYGRQQFNERESTYRAQPK